MVCAPFNRQVHWQDTTRSHINNIKRISDVYPVAVAPESNLQDDNSKSFQPRKKGKPPEKGWAHGQHSLSNSYPTKTKNNPPHARKTIKDIHSEIRTPDTNKSDLHPPISQLGFNSCSPTEKRELGDFRVSKGLVRTSLYLYITIFLRSLHGFDR